MLQSPNPNVPKCYKYMRSDSKLHIHRRPIVCFSIFFFFFAFTYLPLTFNPSSLEFRTLISSSLLISDKILIYNAASSFLSFFILISSNFVTFPADFFSNFLVPLWFQIERLFSVPRMVFVYLMFCVFLFE